MRGKSLQFLAVLLMGLSLIPSGAHLLALPNKIGMNAADYFTAQQIYAGWQFVGAIWIAALIVNLALTVGMRGERPSFHYALAGFLSVALAFAVFFTWTFPANQATANWTEIPTDWETLRTSWEYSHAVTAIILLIGFVSTLLASLSAEG